MVGTSQTPLICIAALPDVKRAIEAGYSVFVGVAPLFTQLLHLGERVRRLVEIVAVKELAVLEELAVLLIEEGVEDAPAGAAVVRDGEPGDPLPVSFASAALKLATPSRPFGLPSSPSRPAFFSMSLL